MEKKQLPTQAQIKEVLHYDPETGIFRWRFVMSNGKNKPWDIAGYVNRGYVRIKLNKKTYECHRLAFLYMVGKWPKTNIDHIDGCPSNNKWVNLREATYKQNNENVKLRKDNKSGYRGVIWSNAAQKWAAQVRHNKKATHLGCFNSPEEAAAVAAAKRAELFTHDTRRDQITNFYQGRP